MTSRTEDCIAMLPTGNLSGIVKMMSIATGKIVSRDQFIILPMPSGVIAKLNELACKEGRHVKINGRGTYDGEPLNSVDLPSFAEAPTGPVSDPMVQINNEDRDRIDGKDTTTEFLADHLGLSDHRE